MRTDTFFRERTGNIPSTEEEYKKKDEYPEPVKSNLNTSRNYIAPELFMIISCTEDLPCEGYFKATISSDESRVHELIQRIYTSPSILHNEKIANRCYSLQKDAREEEPESAGIFLDSLQSFYDFLVQHNNLKYPIITLTPDNNIYASWKADAGRVFSIHFLDNNNVRFVMFMPNEKHLGQKIRISGSATTDTLKRIASNAWEWIS